MRIRFWFPTMTAGALALLSLASAVSRAGSWFGPCCYGADYAYQYPNRAHNTFGCGPGTNCTARHPLFKRHWARKHQAAPAGGPPVVAEPFQYAPFAPAPAVAAPVEAVSVPAAPVSPRIEPVAQPLPAGTTSVPVTPSSKPPF